MDQIQTEYQALRTTCGLIEYAGAGLLTVSGPSAAEFLGRAATRSVDFLLEGQICAALLLREDAGVVAEIQIHGEGDGYLVEVWPAQARAAAEHLAELAARTTGVTVTDVSDQFVLFGLEGPESFRLAQKYLPFPIASMAYRSFTTAELPSGQPLLVSRTGVTGEYGYKLHVPAASGEQVRAELLELGAVPCGIDAVDICRMECRFVNLEAELDPAGGTPLDLGLQWMVGFGQDFVGKEALLKRREDTAAVPVCWVAADGHSEVPAAGTPVLVGNTEVGAVAHAVYSPGLERLIGVARLDQAVAASGLDFRVGAAEVRTHSAPLRVATSFGVPLE
nr:glycine cleavage T C-terminal barrel domain-containing protein [Kibdelosporangium sp. MJ126-NF4]CTQ90957.1 Aminomethyltransferase (glycine cleavage system T protein) (EC 2.1.2.10) [Kibdelosporangium sp. MJ126-NF4]